MTKLLFYGGVKTIGGNCVILEDNDQRLMIDNGMCFDKDNDYYKDFLMTRGGNDSRDYLQQDLIPPINGIYGEDVLRDIGIDLIDPDGKFIYETNIESYESYKDRTGKPFIKGFLLSHAHIDHYRNILFMHPDIPIYCSKITFDLLKIISELSFQDFLNYKTYKLSKYGRGSYFPGAVKKDTVLEERTFTIVKPSEPQELDPFTVTGYPVDHSIVGAMAFQIKTKSGKNIVYTGDIRFHGHQWERENSEKFVKTVSGVKPNVLIAEGTKIDSKKDISEDDVVQETLKHIKKEKKAKDNLILVSFPWKNISRFLTVYQIAKELNRTLVIQPKLAYILHNLGKNPTLKIKDILKTDDIQIYLPRKRSMLYSLGDYIGSKVCISYDVNWEKTKDHKINLYQDIYGDDIHIKAYQLNKTPQKYLVHLQFYDINQLIDIRPPKKSLFFSMRTEPYDEESMLERQILENWITKYDLKLISIHASGHASGKDLVHMIEQVDPGLIFPIHTEKPDLFKMKNVISDIRIGKEYEI